MSLLLGGRVTDSLLHSAAWEAKRNGDPLFIRVDFDALDIRYEQRTQANGFSKGKTKRIVHVNGPVTIGSDAYHLEGRGDGATSAFVAGLNAIMEEKCSISVDVDDWVERAVTHEDAGVGNAQNVQEPGREALVWGFSSMRVGSDVLDGYGHDPDATIASMKACLQAVNRWYSMNAQETPVAESA